jgi:hypothetical protein
MMKMKNILTVLALLLSTSVAWGQINPILRSGFTTNAPGATVNAAGSTLQNVASMETGSVVLNGVELGPLTAWVALGPDSKQDAHVNLTAWAEVSPSSKQDALGFTPQVGSLNLTNWSEIAPSSKQDASSILSDLASVGAGADGDIFYRGPLGFTVLSAGADGRVLKLQSGLPTWGFDLVGEGGGGGSSLFVNESEIPGANLISGTGYAVSIASDTNVFLTLAQPLLNLVSDPNLYHATNATLTRLQGVGSGDLGDLLYRDANGWTNLPAGTAGQVLLSTGTGLEYGEVTLEGIGDGEITLAKLADMTPDRVLGRITGSPGAPEELTADQVLSILENATNSVVFQGSVTAPTLVGDSIFLGATDLEAALAGKVSSAALQDVSDAAVKVGLTNSFTAFSSARFTGPVTSEVKTHTSTGIVIDASSDQRAHRYVADEDNMTITIINRPEDPNLETFFSLTLTNANPTTYYGILWVDAYPVTGKTFSSLPPASKVEFGIRVFQGRAEYDYIGNSSTYVARSEGGTGGPWGTARDAYYPIINSVGTVTNFSVNFGMGQMTKRNVTMNQHLSSFSTLAPEDQGRIHYVLLENYSGSNWELTVTPNVTKVTFEQPFVLSNGMSHVLSVMHWGGSPTNVFVSFPYDAASAPIQSPPEPEPAPSSLSEGLMALYTFDEDSTTVLSNKTSTGAAYDMTPPAGLSSRLATGYPGHISQSWTNGIGGARTHLRASSSDLKVPESGQRTYVAVITPYGPDTWIGTAETTSTDLGWYVWRSGGNFRFSTGSSGTAINDSWDTGVACLNGITYFVVMTLDTENNTKHFSATPIGEASAMVMANRAMPGLYQSAANLSIISGTAGNTGAGNYMLFDLFAVYNRAVTQVEIDQAYGLNLAGWMNLTTP